MTDRSYQDWGGVPNTLNPNAVRALGLGYASQIQKLRTRPWACVTNIVMHDTSGRNQDAFCIHLDTLPMWLATVNEGLARVG